jgi:hypothetical protein
VSAQDVVARWQVIRVMVRFMEYMVQIADRVSAINPPMNAQQIIKTPDPYIADSRSHKIPARSKRAPTIDMVTAPLPKSESIRREGRPGSSPRPRV